MKSRDRDINIFIFFVVITSTLMLQTLNVFGGERQLMDHIIGQLDKCPDRPNCVCSEHPGAPGFVEPLDVAGDSELAWEKIKKVVTASGGKIEKTEGNYLHATFTSAIFGFVDDAEFRMDSMNKSIHVRSAARTGYYDFGVNRRRVNRLRQLLHSKGHD